MAQERLRQLLVAALACAALGAGALAVVAVVLSLIGAFYYLRVVKLMYMDEPAREISIEVRGDSRALLSANALAVLALGIVPGPLMDLCARAVTASL